VREKVSAVGSLMRSHSGSLGRGFDSVVVTIRQPQINSDAHG
jgi:hypothetical protein